MIARRLGAAAACALVAILGGTPAAQTPAAAAPYTVLSKEGRKPLAVRAFGGQEMFALDDLARLFDLTVREDPAAGGLTVTARNQTIVLSPGQSLASVGGRLISMPAAPVHEGRTWYVPADFVARALAPVLAGNGSAIELRRSSRLLIIDVRAPRVVGRIEPLGSVARLTVDVAPATPHTITQDGSHLIIRFEADTLDAALPVPGPPDLIQGLRIVDPANLTIDLGPRFSMFRASDLPADRGAGRIVIDLIAQTTEAQAQPAVPAPAQPQDAPPLIDLAPAGGLRTIVIDAGHGGTEEGSRGANGTVEKQVTLTVARRLKGVLEARLGIRVILTRDGDASVGLDERAALANNNKADLFVSLHANASVRATASGAEVFYLSPDEYGDAAQQVANAPGDALPVFGGGTRDIELIPWDMAQVRYIRDSAALAQTVEAALRERVPMSPRAIQQAPFRVLVGANMPAVLVEMGFISNAEQEKQLASDEFQSAIVQALVDSITRFRDARGSTRAGTLR